MKLAGKGYGSVAEMVRGVADDPAFADDFERHLAGRQLIRKLTTLRCVLGLSQAEVAGRMGCSQAKVSKLESSPDADIALGDFLRYVDALGHGMRIVLAPRRSSGAEHIRFHADGLRRELNRLLAPTGGDRPPDEGVESFAIETMLGLVGMIREAIGRLPRRPDRASDPLRVEVEGDTAERLAEAPGRAKRGRRVAPTA